MHSILRPLKHARASDLLTRQATAPTVSHLKVSGLDCLHQPHHIHQVQQLLQKTGLVKLSLEFSDDSSRYLQGLIVGLSQFHGHGLPIDHSASQGWFWEIRPSAAQFQSNGCQARSETMEEFPWHTDCSYEEHPPQYFALQVLQPDQRGGGLFSALHIQHILDRLSPVARAALGRPEFRITVPPEFVRASNKSHIIGSILAMSSSDRGRDGHGGVATGRVTIRFREDIVTALTSEGARAVEELKTVLMSPGARRDTLHLPAEDMPRGSILVLDNRRWLHARNEVKDPARHLRRVRWDARAFSSTKP